MAKFDKAIETVLRNEGGYINSPSDPGKATNFGISLSFLKTIKSDATEADIRNLTRQQAIDLYQKYFWQYDAIFSQSIATKVFDLAVTMGNIDANICLQRAVLCAGNISLTQDGILGQLTLNAVSKCEAGLLFTALKSEGAAHYRIMAAIDPKLKQFLNGWLNRAYANI